MSSSDTPSAGARLLRSAEVAAAAAAVDAQVDRQVNAALLGPFAGVLSAAAPVVPASPFRPPTPDPGDEDDDEVADGAAQLLNREVPRRFIAAGAALSAALGAVAAGDETRAAGALLCAQGRLFPGDQAGRVAVAAVCRPVLDRMRAGSFGWVAPGGEPVLTPEALQQRMTAGVAALERAYQAASAGVEVAALGTASWQAMTGGAGAASGMARAQFGPFIGGLVRWAFFTEAALDGVLHDDWPAVGACLVAARRDVQRGSGDSVVVPL